MQWSMKSKYIKSTTFNDKNRWIIKKIVLSKLLPHLATRGTYSPGEMKCDVSKHWSTLQWCASRGWVIAHENWTSFESQAKPWDSPMWLWVVVFLNTPSDYQIASFHEINYHESRRYLRQPIPAFVPENQMQLLSSRLQQQHKGHISCCVS